MDAPLHTPTRRELFAGFCWLGLTGFGGVLPLAHRMLVQQRRWLSEADFAELLALGQLLPGPNIVNLAVALGGRLYGAWGALLAVLGLLLAPMLVVLSLATLYERFQHWPLVQQALHGLSAAAAGLVLAMALRLIQGLPRRRWVVAIVVLTFAVVALWRLPLLLALAGLIPLALWLSWWRREGGA